MGSAHSGGLGLPGGLGLVLSPPHAGMETHEQPTLQPGEGGKVPVGHWLLEMIAETMLKTTLSLFSLC